MKSILPSHLRLLIDIYVYNVPCICDLHRLRSGDSSENAKCGGKVGPRAIRVKYGFIHARGPHFGQHNRSVMSTSYCLSKLGLNTYISVLFSDRQMNTNR